MESSDLTAIRRLFSRGPVAIFSSFIPEMLGKIVYWIASLGGKARSPVEQPGRDQCEIIGDWFYAGDFSGFPYSSSLVYLPLIPNDPMCSEVICFKKGTLEGRITWTMTRVDEDHLLQVASQRSGDPDS